MTNIIRNEIIVVVIYLKKKKKKRGRTVLDT